MQDHLEVLRRTISMIGTQRTSTMLTRELEAAKAILRDPTVSHAHKIGAMQAKGRLIGVLLEAEGSSRPARSTSPASAAQRCAKCGGQIYVAFEDEDTQGKIWVYCSEECKEKH